MLQNTSLEHWTRFDALLLAHAGTNLSDPPWVRQPSGKPGRKTFAAIIERLTLLRVIAIDPDVAAGVHPDCRRRPCQEGARLARNMFGSCKRRGVALHWWRPYSKPS